MNGAQVRMLSKIHRLFIGILLLLITVPFNIYSIIHNGPINPGGYVVPYKIIGNLVLYNGMNIEWYFGISLSILIITGALYGGNYYFTHSVFKYDKKKGAVSRSGYLGSILLFVGLLFLLVSGLPFLLTILYNGTYNYTTGSALPHAIDIIVGNSYLFQELIYYIGAILSIAGIFLISVEFLKLSMKYVSPTLALGSATLFLLILPILNSYAIESIVGPFGGIILYAMSFASLSLILFGLRDVSKKIKGERTTSIEIPYL